MHARSAPPFSAVLPALRTNLADAAQSAALSIRSGFVWLIPLLMVSSLATFCALVLELAGMAPELTSRLLLLVVAGDAILPYAIATALSATLAIRWHLPRPAVVVLAIGQVAMIMALYRETHADATAIGIISGVLVPFVQVPLLGMLSRPGWMHLTDSEAAGDNIRASLNLVLPAVVVTMLMMSLALLIHAMWPASLLTDWMTRASNTPGDGTILYALMNSALWSVGLHGYHLLLPMLDALEQGTQGARTFLGAFVFIGGSGATLSLALALLIASRSPTHRMLAASSLPLALFNVNELLLFGLPIVFNPRLILPFVLVPALNAAVGQLFVALSWLQLGAASVPFNSPILLNAWLATDGHWSGVALQLACVALGTAIYLPFVRHYERHRQDTEVIFRWLDTTFRQRSEEAATLLDDPVGNHVRRMREETTLLARLRSLSDHEFFLQYQPQVRPADDSMTGCEALIRARDSHGATLLPGAFLLAFERAHMSREIDLWVLEHAINQRRQWNAAGSDVTVSVNVSAESLEDPHTVARMQALIGQAPGRLHVEVTERALASDSPQVVQALNSLRQAGAEILIDDFGTEYSSLSYLHRYPIDGIKIDRSFVLALREPRGRAVFAAIVGLARELDLQIVVEGVETDEQLGHVPRDTRTSVQGWYYAKALDPAAIPAMLGRDQGGGIAPLRSTISP